MIELIRRLSAPLAPRPVAGCLPRLRPVGGVRGVLLDVYGTLLISAAGDLGSGAASPEARNTAMATALNDAGLAHAAPDAPNLVTALEEAIRGAHAEARARGVAHPDVEIRELWRGLLPGAGTAAVERAAVSYECRINPVWPMPGAAAAVAALQARGPVGIVSNAQFFTAPVLAALLPELRIDPRLAVWSFAEREAKPSPRLFAAAAARMARHYRLRPREIVMVGNDVRNDLLGARAAGLRTALFAGDARSLRLRRDDPSCAAVHPDLVLTHLSQLPVALVARGGTRRRADSGGAQRRASPRGCGPTNELQPASPPQHARGGITPVAAATRASRVAGRLHRVARSAAARTAD